MVAQQRRDESSLVQMMLEREDKLRQEIKQQIETIRKEIKTSLPAQAISEPQLVALQARLEGLHMAKLLTDDELCLFEDMVADFVEHRSEMGIVTLQVIHKNENANKLMKLVAVSESIVADAAFARQARRKYL